MRLSQLAHSHASGRLPFCAAQALSTAIIKQPFATRITLCLFLSLSLSSATHAVRLVEPANVKHVVPVRIHKKVVCRENEAAKAARQCALPAAGQPSHQHKALSLRRSRGGPRRGSCRVHALRGGGVRHGGQREGGGKREREKRKVRNRAVVNWVSFQRCSIIE